MVYDPEKRKKQYEKHKSSENMMNQIYHQKNKERDNKRTLSNYYKNKEKYLEKQKERTSTEEYKKQKARYMRERYLKIRNNLFIFLGNKCLRCGMKDKRVLQFDHKEGQGIHDRKIKNIKNGTGLVNYYIQHLEEAKKELQILCSNCNIIKEFENHEFRHYTDVETN